MGAPSAAGAEPLGVQIVLGALRKVYEADGDRARQVRNWAVEGFGGWQEMERDQKRDGKERWRGVRGKKRVGKRWKEITREMERREKEIEGEIVRDSKN